MNLELLSLWAKHEEDNENFHPLLYHLWDVRSVSEVLWQTVIPPCIKTQWSTLLNMSSEESGHFWAIIAALHDIGKCNPFFQLKWKKMRTVLPSLHINLPNTMVNLSHGVVTSVILNKYDKTNQKMLTKVIGGHHGLFPSASLIKDTRRQLNNIPSQGKWEEFHSILFQDSLISDQMNPYNLPLTEFPIEILIILAGWITIADWIGSAKNFFPYSGGVFDTSKYLETINQKALSAISTIGWMGWKNTAKYKSFQEMFPYIQNIRQLQQKAIELAPTINEPSIIIMEAPMGEGKTEAAVYLADYMNITLQNIGIFFALPTQATSNQMFTRVRDYLSTRYAGEYVNLNLIHGHAALSSDYLMLKERFRLIQTIADIDESSGYDNATASVIASEWFTHRKLGLLCPFGVGTVDQALLSVLQTKHFFVRLAGLAGKTIIIDEVHAYDAYMLCILENLLQWLAVMHSSVILLSATLSQERRNALINAFRKGLKLNPLQPIITEYPRITISNTKLNSSITFPANKITSVKVEWVNGSINEHNEILNYALFDKLQDQMKNGGCVAIICNTIKRAQIIFRILSRDLDKFKQQVEIQLFHSHFRFCDRDLIEKQVIKYYGKQTKENYRPKCSILIATQVIEQSLDLDFDLIVSDLAPIDLILQRVGRMHRHNENNPKRPSNFKQPKLWICEPELKNNIPEFSVDQIIYNSHILLRSWLILKENRELIIPNQIETYIEKAYSKCEPPAHLSDEMQNFWQESQHKLLDDLKKKRDIANKHLIPSPNDGYNIFMQDNQQLEEDNPDIHQSLQALTRLSSPTIHAVILKSEENIDELKPEDLLRRSMSLSERQFWSIVKLMKKPETWKKSALLRHHFLIQLNSEGFMPIGDRILYYDQKLGLYEKDERSKES